MSCSWLWLRAFLAAVFRSSSIQKEESIMADTTALDAAIAALEAQATETETVGASAIVLINGFAAQVTTAVAEALAADDVTDQGVLDRVAASIEAVRARFGASEDALGAAVAANTTPVEPTPEP